MRPPNVSEGLLVPLQLLKRFPPHMKCLEVVGPQLVAQIEVDDGLLETRGLMQKDGGLVRGIPVAGGQFKRVLKAQDRLVTAAKLGKCQSEIFPQVSVIRL
jgi:hypothetical protein